MIAVELNLGYDGEWWIVAAKHTVLYEAVKSIKKGRVTVGYVIKDSFGREVSIPNNKIREYIKSGKIIKGLKLTKDDRVIIDKTMYGQIIKKVDESITISTGDNLVRLCNSRVSRFKPRDYVNDIVRFAQNYEYDRIFVVHGIRRTGKTVSIMHSIVALNELGVNARNLFYININNSNTSFGDLVAKLSNIRDSVVFIDEITFIPEIINKINYLVDILASQNRLKIIVAGTDSYVFPIAQLSSLFGRIHMAHSTFISYKEYVSVLGLNKSDSSYMQYVTDGTLYGKEYSTFNDMDKKLQGAIIKNIENTINRNREAVASDTTYCDILKYKASDMLFIIYNILISATSPKSIRNLTDIVKSKIGKERVGFLASAFSMDESEITRKLSGISNNDLKTMVKVLEELDIVNRINNLAGLVINSKPGYESITDQEICTNIPGLLNTLLLVLNTQNDRVAGIGNENIVLSNLCGLKPKIFEVYYLKYKFNGEEHEIDAVVKIQEKLSFNSKYILIEIKTDSIDKASHARHLVDESLPAGIKENIAKRIVLYMGDDIDKIVHGYKVKYINIIKFLGDMEAYLDLR